MARAGMSDEEMTTFLKETFCVDSARTVWDFQRTTLASGVWRTYLPTLRAVPTDAAAPTYLPPRLWLELRRLPPILGYCFSNVRRPKHSIYIKTDFTHGI